MSLRDCRYNRLEFADVVDIESLATKSICSRGRGDLGLKEAWALFKMGQPVRSYYALEEVLRIRSRLTHQHVSYYLACLNIKNLRPSFALRPISSRKSWIRIKGHR